jgi:aminoglycoside phosphotransferase (APT) family kinase protein
MSDDELRIDADVDVARRLLREQMPRWADLALERVDSAGVNNTIYRLGEHHAVRLPQTEWAAGHIRKEQRWLPEFAGRLPLEIPALAGVGVPGDDFPWHWSVYRWLEGAEAVVAPVSDEQAAALALGEFVTKLQQLPTGDGPRSGPHSALRGTPLPVRDAVVRDALRNLEGTFDTEAATAAWQAALRVPPWRRAPVWLHGDIHPGNLLVRDGAVRAVIDWEMLSVGDPALDLSAGWMVLSPAGRATFRKSVAADDDTWARARGWALCIGVLAAAYYRDSNPVLAGFSLRAAEDVVAEFVREG